MISTAVPNLNYRKYSLSHSYSFLPERSGHYVRCQICTSPGGYDTINKVVYKLLIDPIKGNVLNIQKNSRQLNLPSHLGSCQTLYYGYEPVYTYYYDAGFLCPDYYYMGPVMQGNEYFVLNVDFTEFPCSQPTPGHFWSSQNNFSTLEARQFFTAFWGIQQSQIFFADLGTNRITSNARVWIEPDIDYSYPNAEYDPDGHYFSFGGPVINKCNHMVELDIVGHEYTHAIINYLAGDLSYSGETGAIEEGLCDAFGAMIESYSQGFSSSTIYTMGLNSIQDNLYRRSLQYPNLMGGHSISDNCQQYATGQPDTYHGLYWDYRGCDGSGIHTNSTIMSHWFYLLAEGGSGVNDFNQSFNVTGIGRDAATLIIYKFIKNQYLDYGTSFSDARNATIRVACEEYGLCSNEYYQVINAWNAVGVSSSYYGIDQVALVNPSTLVCYPGGSSFNLNCLPCTGTITWNKSSNLTFVGGSTGSSVTVRPLSSSTFGPGYLYATLSTTCGNFQTATVNFWVGKFESTVVSGTSGVCPNKTYIYTALVPGGHSASYTYNWLYPSNWVKLSQSQNSITLRTPSNPNYGTVRVSITNNCGPSGYSGITAYPGYNCQGYFTLHPNPANDEVTVTIVQPETLLIEDFESIKDVEIFDPSSNNSEYTVRIYNKIGTLVESVVMSGIKFTFPLRNLRDGTYIVEVSDGKLAHREQLIINHK